MTSPIQLRHLRASDEQRFLTHARRSRHLHSAWVQVPRSRTAFHRYLDEMNTPEDQAFVVIRRDSQDLVGVVELQDIFRGDFQNAYLIYYAFEGQLRQGFMKEAVQQVVAKAFGPLKLHRLEANIQPDNLASLALVKSCGFEYEGLSRQFLRKNGEWKDHQRWSRLKD
jgi:ribosomal-protein-alanine N-acetyltransferase